MRKRSKYRPKGVRLDCMAWVKSGLTPVSQVEDAGITLKIKNHQALANMTQGKGTRDDVDVLIGAVNITEALARAGIGRDWSAEIRAAQDAIFTMAKRGVERGRFLFTGPEMQSVNLVMDVHDAQLDSCTVGQLERALDLVASEIRNKKARAIA